MSREPWSVNVLNTDDVSMHSCTINDNNYCVRSFLSLLYFYSVILQQ